MTDASVRGDLGGALAAVLDLSQTITKTGDCLEAFKRAAKILSDHRGIERACLLTLDDATGKLVPRAAFGLSAEEMSKGRYFPGEGITGSVVATGRTRIVPDTSREPDFLNRVGRPAESFGAVSFLCVPLRIEGQVTGVIWADKAFPGEAELSTDHALLEIVASLFSQSLQCERVQTREKNELLASVNETRAHAREKYQFDGIIGDAPVMQEVFATVGQVASSRATVLLLGETGTGKEMIAKAIHLNSPRRNNSFIRVNCGALTGTLLESELFGHARGSFTGAFREKIGRFEAADGGTIFLDEIGTLEPELQVKLLRVLQEREFERVGDTHTIKIDVRVIAATNLDLQEEVAKGTFREDLFYRLNVVSIYLPPLRNRREDIPKLINFFLDKYNAANERNLRKISREMLATLLRYPWPGNVRELENAMERAVVLSRGDDFTEDLLPLGLRMFAAHRRGLPATESIQALTRKLAEQAVSELEHQEGKIQQLVVDQLEKSLIECALAKCGNVKLKAADFLGINRNTLNKKVKDLGIETAE